MAELIRNSKIDGLRLFAVQKNKSSEVELRDIVDVQEGWVASEPATVCGATTTYTKFGWRGAIHRVVLRPPAQTRPEEVSYACHVTLHGDAVHRSRFLASETALREGGAPIAAELGAVRTSASSNRARSFHPIR